MWLCWQTISHLAYSFMCAFKQWITVKENVRVDSLVLQMGILLNAIEGDIHVCSYRKHKWQKWGKCRKEEIDFIWNLTFENRSLPTTQVAIVRILTHQCRHITVIHKRHIFTTVLTIIILSIIHLKNNDIRIKTKINQWA